MFDKIMYKAYKAYWDFQLRLMEIANDDEEDGAEVVEVIIIIAIVIVVAALISDFLTKDGFTKADGSTCGLVGYVLDNVSEKIKAIFGDT